MEIQGFKEAILEAGIVGAGGAGFPTHVKLVPHMDTIIINGAECEPLLYTDEQLLTHYGEELIATLHELMLAYNIPQGVIGIKKKYSELIARLEGYAINASGIKIVAVDTIYPIGDEVTLIRACTGRVVGRGKLPSSQGVVVMNVETLLNIHNKLAYNQPVTHTYLTLNGEVEKPQVYKVPIGMTIKAFLSSVGETLEDKLILLGGPMMGNFVDANTLITKTTKGIILLPPNHVLHRLKQLANTNSVKRIMSSCSQCRMCTDLCPRNRLGHKVEPHKVMNAFANGLLTHYDGIDTALGCCGCNVCSYYACHHDLAPGTMMMAIKREMLKAGIKGEGHEDKAPQDAAYLKVPSTRLVERIGLGKYQEHALLQEEAVESALVTIPLLQHVGQPARCIVKEGEGVEVGQLLAVQPEKGLGTTIHSSISGTVRQVKKDAIVIQERRG